LWKKTSRTNFSRKSASKTTTPAPPHIPPFLPLSFCPFESVEEQEMHVFPQQECAAAYQRQKKRLITEQQRGFSRPFFPPSFRPRRRPFVKKERF